MRRYTTLWNVCAQKSPRFRAEWSDMANCHAKLSDSKQLRKYIHPAMFVQICSLTKKIFTVLTPKPKKITNCAQLWQPRKKTSRQNFQASVGESQVVEKTQVIQLSITESRLLKAVIVTWCCYNSYCPSCVRSQASSPSFSKTVPDVWGYQLSNP